MPRGARTVRACRSVFPCASSTPDRGPLLKTDSAASVSYPRLITAANVRSGGKFEWNPPERRSRHRQGRRVRCPAPRRRWAGHWTCCCTWPASPGPVSGAAIARDLKIPRSSTYHLLDVLIARGFVVHFPDERTYGLGMAAFEIGSAYLRHEPLEMLARPVLRRLVAQVGETAHLGVLHGAETLYLLKEQPRHVPDPGHAGHRHRGAAARAPDRQRPVDPGPPARRPGARVVPVGPRLRRPHRARPRHAAGTAPGAGRRAAAEVGRGDRPGHRRPAVGGGLRVRPLRAAVCGASA